MNKRALKAIEIETFALSTSATVDERLPPVSHDDQEHLPKPETGGSAALSWLIDAFAIAGAGMAGVYVGVLLDPWHASDNQTSGKADGTAGGATEATR
jgi:hypothetical protein